MASLPAADLTQAGQPRSRTLALTLGALGGVFGDIGTSPLYAFREALGQAGRVGAAEISGVLSLAIWALILVVTIKYLLFLIRADNDGEGGVLSLMALAQKGMDGRRTALILGLGALGAALFYGDAVITPAISVLSAVEGLRTVPALVGHVHTGEVLAISLAILAGLFLVQARGAPRVTALFGPVCVLWFAVIGGIGAVHLLDEPSVLGAVDPLIGARFLAGHGKAGALVLGAVFLTVTGAEALTADMGRFGRGPIQAGWLFVVFPALLLNYFGQAAFALKALERAAAEGRAFVNADWFFLMAPEAVRPGLVVLAAAATVIAGHAVIAGAYSLTRQAIQLGLLPRMSVRKTSGEAGGIYIGRINWFLFVGVLFVALAFRTSSALAHAYGVAVTGTMLVTTCLAFLVVRKAWRWSVPLAAAVIAPFLALDLTFFAANALRIPTGGWAPLMLGAGLCLVMATWVKGAALLAKKTGGESMRVGDLLAALNPETVYRAPGTAVFLSSDPDRVPLALMHNLKHNKVLHERNAILTVRTLDSPYAPEAERLTLSWIAPDFARVVLNYGYMETPNVPKALGACRKQGLKFDIVSTSFFLSRRSIVRASRSEMPAWQDKLFLFLAKNATDPTTYFHIPPGRAVEMGAQIAV